MSQRLQRAVLILSHHSERFAEVGMCMEPAMACGWDPSLPQPTDESSEGIALCVHPTRVVSPTSCPGLDAQERREKERQQLADLIGKNLVLLSQLEGMGIGMYQLNVLPRIMEQIVQCKDDIAQQYLMDCMIQA